MLLLNGRLEIKTGDITKENADAIVNAANSSLMGGGGVDGAIHRNGGPAILKACREIRNNQYPDGLPAGKAVITEAGKLPCRFIIHTVGPVWHGGSSGESETLKSCYYESLFLARQANAESVCFPAVSTGVYGYPKKKAALTVFSTVSDFIKKNKKPAKIILIFFDKTDTDIFINTLKENNIAT
jgi:O-acetyl-ADP-ribose deacetylase